jgi:hypothetical protein
VLIYFHFENVEGKFSRSQFGSSSGSKHLKFLKGLIMDQLEYIQTALAQMYRGSDDNWKFLSASNRLCVTLTNPSRNWIGVEFEAPLQAYDIASNLKPESDRMGCSKANAVA